MAKLNNGAGRVVAVLVSVAGLAAAGCQPRSQLPEPSFMGPVVAQRSVVAVAPQPQVLPPSGGGAARANPQHVQPGIPGVPRDWIPRASVRPWRYIVIHHSATPTGGALAFDRMHRDKGWDELGYDFVIGNGSDTGNGQIEVGPRWPKQKYGAHTKTPDNRYNEYGIGICLVGNFDVTNPTPQQMRSLARLVAYLMYTYRIPPKSVVGHSDCKPTDCPGHHMHVAEVRRMATQMLAESEWAYPGSAALARGASAGKRTSH